MSRIKINPPELAEPRGFNHGFLCSGGQTLFLAGQDASGPEGKIIAGNIVTQYEQVIKNLQAVCQAAGGSLQDVVKMNIFVRSRDDYLAHLKEIGRVHRRYFGTHYPAAALFEVTGFFQKENLIEIEGIAYLES